MTIVTQQVNDKTSFVMEDGRLVALDEAEEIEEQARREQEIVHLGEDQAWQLIPDRVREHDRVLFATTSDFVLDKIKTWLTIRSEQEEDFKLRGVYRDLIHGLAESSLLDRLLDGIPPLKNPPPKSYSHAWYDLVDNGEDVCEDVYFTWSNWNIKGLHHDRVRIDAEEWSVLDLEEIDDRTIYTIFWPKDEETLYSLTRMTEEDKDRLLHPRMRRLSDGKDKYSWKIKRMEKDDGE